MRTCKKLALLLLSIVIAPVHSGETAEHGKYVKVAKSFKATKQVVTEKQETSGAAGKGSVAQKKAPKTARNVSPPPQMAVEPKASKSFANASHGFTKKNRLIAKRKGASTVASIPRSSVVMDDGAIQKRISSRSAVILDARTGETLYDQNGDLPRQPASTLKVLTGLLAIEHLHDRDPVPTSRHAAEMPSSKVNLQIGKTYPATDIINAVLLESANDASVAVAEKVAGSEEEFAQIMTARARKLGANNTQCKTASGLTAEGQYSTARDLATIFRKAMQNPEFATRMARQQTKTGEGKLLRNHNKALWRLEGAEGGKTGFTNAARQTYVGKFRRGGDELIVALMGSESMWRDLQELVEFGFKKKQHVDVAATDKNKDDVKDQLAIVRANLLGEELKHKKRQDLNASL